MTIRPAELFDLDQIYAIESRSFSDAWTREQILEDLMTESLPEYFVMEVDNQIVGYLLKRFAGGEMDILNIAVDPAHRGHGYGKILMRFALDSVPENTPVYLEVRKSNNIAIQLYIAMGFSQVGSRSAYYQDGEDAFLMKKIQNKY